MKNKKGSMLAYALIILTIVFVIAGTISFTTIVEKKSASSTEFSIQAFQNADNGAQYAKKQIYNSSGGDTIGNIFTDVTCDSNGTGPVIVSKDYGDGREWKITFKDSDGNFIDNCGDLARNIDIISSLGTYKDTARNVDLKVMKKNKIGPNADIVLVMDYSASVSIANLKREKSAAIDLVNNLGSEYRVGIVFFSTTTEKHQLTPIANKDKIISFINENPSNGQGRTNTGAAIEDARDILINGLNNRHGVNPQAIVLISDGVPYMSGIGDVYDSSIKCPSQWDITQTQLALLASARAKNDKISIFTISVGFDDLSTVVCQQKADKLMLDIASSSANYISIEKFSDLKGVLDNLTN